MKLANETNIPSKKASIHKWKEDDIEYGEDSLGYRRNPPGPGCAPGTHGEGHNGYDESADARMTSIERISCQDERTNRSY
jgi:hypothetical protein